MTTPPKMVVDDSPELALTDAQKIQVGLHPLQKFDPSGGGSLTVSCCHCATAPRMLTIPAPDLVRPIQRLLQRNLQAEGHVFVQAVKCLFEPADALEGLATQHKAAHAEI